MELGITSSLLVETRILEITSLLLRNVHTICFRSRFIIDSQETSVAAVRCSPDGICGCSTSARLMLGCTDPFDHTACVITSPKSQQRSAATYFSPRA